MKFDFSKYDKKWKWFAIDSDGESYIYTHEPVRIPDATTPIDTKVKVRNDKKAEWVERFFAFYSPKSPRKFYVFPFSAKSEYKPSAVIPWKYCEIIERD